MELFPVILAGGSGYRLWPLSNQNRPKQFLKLLGEYSLFQETLLRLRELAPADATTIVCGERHQDRVWEDLKALGLEEQARVIGEPVGRNTAPAILLAIRALEQKGRDPVLVVLPADHIIGNNTAFLEQLRLAVRAAEADAIITLGITPTGPETGYGYIEARGEGPVLEVCRFVEKPNRTKAESYLEAGNYFWNAGIFVFKASRMLAELNEYQPDIVARVDAFLDGDREAYARAPALSIDHAVMEHTRRARVAPVDCGWSDLGSWRAVSEAMPEDKNGNGAKGDAMLIDCKNSYIHSERRLVAGIGLEHLVVVETNEAVLVAQKTQTQRVKEIAARIEAQESQGARTQITEYRPWGDFTILEEAPTHKTKRLTLLPGRRFSLQMHEFRTEHWVIVSGTARVTLGEETRILKAGESVVVPVRTKHRMENTGNVPVCFIETQLGSYFGRRDRMAPRTARMLAEAVDVAAPGQELAQRGGGHVRGQEAEGGHDGEAGPGQLAVRGRCRPRRQWFLASVGPPLVPRSLAHRRPPRGPQARHRGPLQAPRPSLPVPSAARIPIEGKFD